MSLGSQLAITEELVQLIVQARHAHPQGRQLNDRLAQAHHHHMTTNSQNLTIQIGVTTFGIEIDGISRDNLQLRANHLEVMHRNPNTSRRFEISIMIGDSDMADTRAKGTTLRL